MAHIVIIAGEPSGDLIGAKLIDAILSLNPEIKLSGVGGDHMLARNFHSIFPLRDLSVMGFAEIIFKLPFLIYRLHQAYRYIKQQRPDVVVTIDSPGFNFPLIKKLRKALGTSFKAVHYVAPSVWAYKPQRVQKVAELYDHQLLIFPFEIPYFTTMTADYIGHPLLQLFGHDPIDPPTLVVMPGSREGELVRHAPIFRAAIKLLQEKVTNLRSVVLTLPHLADAVRQYFPESSVIVDAETKHRILSTATAALVKSGTSSLEVLQYLLPQVVTYRVNLISAYYIRNQLQIPHISIANIIAGKELIPELLQERCVPEQLLEALLPCFNNDFAKTMALEYELVLNKLLLANGKNPSDLAANVIIGYIPDL